VILLPQVGVVNFATAGIEADGVYALCSNRKAAPLKEHRFKPGTSLKLASIYEEQTKDYKGKHGQPVEWTPWERNGARYGVSTAGSLRRTRGSSTGCSRPNT
jgi:hypothetical protein